MSWQMNDATGEWTYFPDNAATPERSPVVDPSGQSYAPGVAAQNAYLSSYEPYYGQFKSPQEWATSIGLTEEQKSTLAKNLARAAASPAESEWDKNYFSGQNLETLLNPNFEPATGKSDGGLFGLVDKVMPQDLGSAALMFAGLFGVPAYLGAGAAGAGALEGAGAFGGEALGAAANAAGAYGGSVAPWITSGAGALGTGFDMPGGVNAAKDTGAAMPYEDAIEGLIDLTNQGLTGEQAIAALGEINPAWTQTGIEFLMNNPSQIFSGGGNLLKTLFGGGGGAGGSGETDWLSLLGKLGAAGLGAYGSNEQAKSLQDLATKYSEYGAPSRARFEASMTPGFDPMSIPGYSGALDTTSKAILARLSATGGNPFGNPSGLIEANKAILSGTALPAISEYQRLNANTGFGSSMNAAIPFETGAIGQQGNVLNSIGYGLNQVTQPQTSLADLIKSLQMGGLA